jgi:hypothetical protein
MVMSPAGSGPEKDYSGDAQEVVGLKWFVVKTDWLAVNRQ